MREITYPLSAFTKAAPPAADAAGTARADAPAPNTEIVRIASLDELAPYNVPPRVLVIIAQGHHPDQPKTDDNSRSKWLLDAVCQLMRAGVPEPVIRGIITDPGWGISASILDKGSSLERYLNRQIARAKEEIAEDGAEFRRDKNELIVRDSQHNIRVALRKLGVTVRHDEFQDQLLVVGAGGIGPLLDERAMEHLWLLVDEKFGFRPSKDLFWTVVAVAARKAGFHPVRDYLDGLAWDCTPRVDAWLSVYGGAEDSAYTRAVAALMLIAAVRRVRQPGCKFDEMLVLESEQGTDKSSALKVLAVEESWFTDDMPLNADGKGVIERLRGRWLVECAELRGMRRGDIEHVKAFLSRQMDRARLSYDRLNTEVARQSVFFGTTNSSKYLRDTTGARRFWPVRVKAFDLVALRRDRDQLWAEAAQREAAGESIRLDPALYAAAAVEQAERSVEDPFFEQIAHVLSGLTGKILNLDAWEIIGVPINMRTQDINGRFGEAMKALGWERTEGRIEGKKRNVYARGDKQQREVRIHIERDANNRVSAWAELDVDQRQQSDGSAPF